MVDAPYQFGANPVQGRDVGSHHLEDFGGISTVGAVAMSTLRRSSSPVAHRKRLRTSPPSKTMPPRKAGDRVEIGHADIFECNAAATPPEALRGNMQQRCCRSQGKALFPAPDRFLEQAHCDPGRDFQRIANRGLILADRVGQLLSSDAEDVGFVHSGAPPCALEGA
jgi:hypothetical protein